VHRRENVGTDEGGNMPKNRNNNASQWRLAIIAALALVAIVTVLALTMHLAHTATASQPTPAQTGLAQRENVTQARLECEKTFGTCLDNTRRDHANGLIDDTRYKNELSDCTSTAKECMSTA
jgi:hypothetical protein